jgi:hypothetical protein
VLYPLFRALLLIPALRRWRRDPRRWRNIRLGAGAAAVVAGAAAAAAGWWWVVGLAVPLLLASFVLKTASDPDRERELQRRLQADYLLNGGRLIASPAAFPGLRPGTRLSLLLRREELLLVRADGAGEPLTVALSGIQQILVGGQPYRPVYVSEAKDPPVREKSVDKKARTLLTLVMSEAEQLVFEYEGAFSKHLAESAAHAIYTVQRLEAAHGVSGEAPKVFHIVGR